VPRTDEGEIFLTPSEAADLLGVVPEELERLTRSGKLGSITTLAGKRYRRSEVVALRVRAAPPVSRPQPKPKPEPEPEPQAPVRPPTFVERRERARRRAVELLHAADVGGHAPFAGHDEDAYTSTLVDGIAAHRDELDALIGQVSTHWTIERMPIVDRNLLRMGTFELLHTDTPPGVVVDQAVTLAKLLSTEESGRFVNGVLGRIAREHRHV